MASNPLVVLTPAQLMNQTIQQQWQNHINNNTTIATPSWVRNTYNSSASSSQTNYIKAIKNTISRGYVSSANTYTNWTVSDDDDYPPTIRQGASAQAIYDMIANALYSGQHLPDKDPKLSTLIQATSLIAGRLKIRDGEECRIELPDGSFLDVKKDGSYTIEDADATVTYRACRIRDFNSFINASDKLEDFIRYCGTQGVTQTEMLNLPVELFIRWLVIEAAKADRIEEPELPLLEGIQRITKARCDSCGRFMRKLLRNKGVGQCRTQCYEIACSKA